jgi:hypothetical protein
MREQPGGHRREGVALPWGLVPFWVDDPEIGSRMTNARSEAAATKPAFRGSVLTAVENGGAEVVVAASTSGKWGRWDSNPGPTD